MERVLDKRRNLFTPEMIRPKTNLTNGIISKMQERTLKRRLRQMKKLKNQHKRKNNKNKNKRANDYKFRCQISIKNIPLFRIKKHK
jgi:hypothetical protein